MHRWFLCVTLGLSLALLHGVAAAEGQGDNDTSKNVTGDAPAALPKCPVTGESVDFTVSTKTNRGPVYFCCKGCVRKYQGKPEKFAANVKDQRLALTKRPKVQVTCPVDGKPTNPKLMLDGWQPKLSFCSQACLDKFANDAHAYKTALGDIYTYQTKCPVMGEEINPKSFNTLPTGQTIYYCCNGCDAKLIANPAKYNHNLVAQGVNVNWKRINKTHSGHADGHDHDHDH